MPVMSKAQIAASLLINAKKELGITTPSYVKSVLYWDESSLVSDDERVQVDLERMINELSAAARQYLFEKVYGLALWYRLYTECDGDTLCRELTGHMGRPASKVLAEHAAKKVASA